MGYFLGYDIGATKSDCLLADQSGRALAFSQTGPGNHEGVGWAGLKDALLFLTKDILQRAGISAAQISAAGFGIAGYDWPSQRAPHLEVIGQLGLSCPLELVNDAVVGIISGTSQGWGISVISGTGENCWGIDPQGNIGHMTGNSQLMGEYGGAGTIVDRAIRDVAKAWGKRGPETALTETFITQTGAADVEDLLEGIILGRYDLNASHVRLVFETASAGDQVAVEAIRWAGEELGDMVIGVSRQLDLCTATFEVVLVGNTFKGGPLLIDPMKQKVRLVCPEAEFVQLNTIPAVGGVLLGMAQSIGFSPQIRQNLINSTEDLLSK